MDIVLTTSVTTRAVFYYIKKEPFYNRSVRCFHVPMSWRRVDSDEPLKRHVDYQIWTNGKPGKDAEAFEACLAEARPGTPQATAARASCADRPDPAIVPSSKARV